MLQAKDDDGANRAESVISIRYHRFTTMKPHPTRGGIMMHLGFAKIGAASTWIWWPYCGTAYATPS